MIVNQKKNKIIIYGAGLAGKLLLEELTETNDNSIEIIGFIDDKIEIDTKIGNTKVLGNGTKLESIISQKKVNEVIIAMPSVEGSKIRNIISICQNSKVNFKIVPKIIKILKESKVSINQLREIRVEDLIERDLITIDLKIVEKMLRGKTIFVTGAAGSIGSELFRQIAQFNIKKLIGIDHSENGIYELKKSLNDSNFYKHKIDLILGNIQDKTKINFILKKYSPDIIYHAAAYKHVPLMEENPDEAIINNVLGTQNLASLALLNNVSTFIMVSSDKAVNPTNIMGASKRVAEMIVKKYNNKAITNFASVRFGNVLESSGSVIPLFKEQIAKGGPVTVTHPKVYRYFMTIKEAAHLILLSSNFTKQGETFILDMGDPILITDLAKSLIRTAGLIPDKDIKISYIGLRPGEKLKEVTLTDTENLVCVKKDKIFIAPQENVKDFDDRVIKKLAKAAYKKDTKNIISLLKEIVPDFEHKRDN